MEFVRESSLIDYYYCILYNELIHFKVKKTKVPISELVEELTTLMYNFPEPLILQKFQTFYFLLKILTEVHDTILINTWAEKLLNFLSKKYTTKFVDKVYEHLALNELRENKAKHSNGRYWEYIFYSWIFLISIVKRITALRYSIVLKGPN